MGYSARGGLESATYPWGGPYTKMTEVVFLQISNQTGEIKQIRHCTQLKQSHMSQMVIIYITWQGMFQNGQTLLTTLTYEYVSSMNPNVLDASNKRKVVRGGSWKTCLFPTSTQFQYADSARSFIGFRTVQDYMGLQTTKRKN
jgi:hypothetical protein